MCPLQDLDVAVGCVVLVWRPAIFAMSLRDASQVTTSALCLQSCCSIGRRHASRWNAALHVALNAPQMILAALAVEKEMFDMFAAAQCSYSVNTLLCFLQSASGGR